MFYFSRKYSGHIEKFAFHIKRKFHSKVNRGMKIRCINSQQILLEDIDEWLDRDMALLQLGIDEKILFDIYPTTSLETSISGLCVAITVVPSSLYWTIVRAFMSVFITMSFIAWFYKLYVLNYAFSPVHFENPVAQDL